jgi:hypothetical protein
MNFLGVHLVPELLEESWRGLEREHELQRAIRERRREQRATQRAARPSRSAVFVARLRRVVRPAAQGAAPAGC